MLNTGNIHILRQDGTVLNQAGTVFPLEKPILQSAELHTLAPSMFDFGEAPLALRFLSCLLERTYPVRLSEITITNKNKGTGQYESGGFTLRCTPGETPQAGPNEPEWEEWTLLNGRLFTYRGASYRFLMGMYESAPQFLTEVHSPEGADENYAALALAKADSGLIQFVEGDGSAFLVEYTPFALGLKRAFSLNLVDHATFCSLVAAYAEEVSNPTSDGNQNRIQWILDRYLWFLHSVLFKYFAPTPVPFESTPTTEAV